MRRLIIRPGAIGDFVVSIPAIECLLSDYVEVWAATQNVPLARFADRARPIASTGLDLLEVLGPSPQLGEALRGFDSIVSWYGANRAEFRDRVKALELPFRFFAALPPEGVKMHAADYYLRQVREICYCPSDGVPRILCPEALGDFAVIHPFAGSAKKRWPLDRFRELARRLERHVPVRWCAGPEDELPDAVRFTDLYELGCWLAGTRVYIGNDSGPTHIAAAVGAPLVALFGPTDPSVWGPRGERVTVVAAPSLEAISVEQVEAAVAATWRQSR